MQTEKERSYDRPCDRRRSARIGHGPSYVLLHPRLLSSSHADYSPDYIVQGHRFDIVEDLGCYPFVASSTMSISLQRSYTFRTTYLVPLAVPLVYMWPVLLGFASMCFSSMYDLVQRRTEWIVLIIYQFSPSSASIASGKRSAAR